MPEIIPIAEAADPRVADYVAVRERDLAGRRGHFVAEGAVVLSLLLSGASRFPLASVFLAAEGLARWRAGLDALPAEVPVYVAPRALMGAVAGFPIHRGILALGHRTPPLSPASLLPPTPTPCLVLALVGLTNHDNVGGLFRNAAAFGADTVLLDETTCDPLYRKAIRVSSGATLTVPFARAGRAEALVAGLAAAGIVPVALSPAGTQDLRDFVPPARVALVVGTEGEGLPPALLARLRTVRIAMRSGFDSLNVATAAAIALHHVAGVRAA